MYRGFNVNISFESAAYYKAGLELHEKQTTDIREVLDLYLLSNGALDGSKLQEAWFPQVESQVFISHSHSDEKLAITLAGWLQGVFGISSFIDSTVWGYADKLLRTIDNKHCSNDAAHTSYNYELRNFSTSHVHMMLSTALMKMIDKTECLFFLNTPNSITTKDTVENRTKSPWIYAEIAISELIRRKSKDEHRVKGRKISKGTRVFNEGVRIEHQVYLGHLTKLDGSKLADWKTEYVSAFPKREHPLDILYDNLAV